MAETMEMSPLERAARALHDVEPMSSDAEMNEVFFLGLRDVRVRQVRAVLQAIREPSEGMIEAGEAVAMRPFVAAGQFTPETWQAMIDRALSE